jgi:hypothetical protein
MGFGGTEFQPESPLLSPVQWGGDWLQSAEVDGVVRSINTGGNSSCSWMSGASSRRSPRTQPSSNRLSSWRITQLLAANALAEFESPSVALQTKATRYETATNGLAEKGVWLLYREWADVSRFPSKNGSFLPVQSITQRRFFWTPETATGGLTQSASATNRHTADSAVFCRSHGGTPRQVSRCSSSRPLGLPGGWAFLIQGTRSSAMFKNPVITVIAAFLRNCGTQSRSTHPPNHV